MMAHNLVSLILKPELLLVIVRLIVPLQTYRIPFPKISGVRAPYPVSNRSWRPTFLITFTFAIITRAWKATSLKSCIFVSTARARRRHYAIEM